MAKIPFFSKSRSIVRLLIDCGWEIINFRLHYTIYPPNCQLIPYKNIDSFSWNQKRHAIVTAAATNPLPRGEGGPQGRVRNSGGNLKVSRNEQTSSQAKAQEEVFRFSGIVRLPPAFLISQKSVPKSRFLPASPRGKRWALPRHCFVSMTWKLLGGYPFKPRRRPGAASGKRCSPPASHGWASRWRSLPRTASRRSPP